MTYNGGNTTGFVSPAGDSLEGRIDLGEILDLTRPQPLPGARGPATLWPRGGSSPAIS